MLEVVSKIGSVNKSEEEIYDRLSDFNNLGQMLPKDKVSDWQATEETCSFTIEKVGNIELHIIEKQPNKLIKIGGGGAIPMNFDLWIQLKQINTNKTAVRITTKAKVNVMMKKMLKNPLQKALDGIIDNLEKM